MRMVAGRRGDLPRVAAFRIDRPDAPKQSEGNLFSIRRPCGVGGAPGGEIRFRGGDGGLAGEDDSSKENHDEQGDACPAHGGIVQEQGDQRNSRTPDGGTVIHTRVPSRRKKEPAHCVSGPRLRSGNAAPLKTGAWLVVNSSVMLPL
jgi:hypothetical protein